MAKSYGHLEVQERALIETQLRLGIKPAETANLVLCGLFGLTNRRRSSQTSRAAGAAANQASGPAGSTGRPASPAAGSAGCRSGATTGPASLAGRPAICESGHQSGAEGALAQVVGNAGRFICRSSPISSATREKCTLAPDCNWPFVPVGMPTMRPGKVPSTVFAGFAAWTVRSGLLPGRSRPRLGSGRSAGTPDSS